METVLLVNAGATLALAGLIWFVQVVHYPLFAQVGSTEFARYEAAHVRRTGFVVVPLMLTELVSGIALVISVPAGVSAGLASAGLALIALIWLSTFALQVPQHRALERGFNPHAQRLLVRTNALRVALWSARGILVLVMAASLS